MVLWTRCVYHLTIGYVMLKTIYLETVWPEATPHCRVHSATLCNVVLSAGITYAYCRIDQAYVIEGITNAYRPTLQV